MVSPAKVELVAGHGSDPDPGVVGVVAPEVQLRRHGFVTGHACGLHVNPEAGLGVRLGDVAALNALVSHEAVGAVQYVRYDALASQLIADTDGEVWPRVLVADDQGHDETDGNRDAKDGKNDVPAFFAVGFVANAVGARGMYRVGHLSPPCFETSGKIIRTSLMNAVFIYYINI